MKKSIYIVPIIFVIIFLCYSCSDDANNTLKPVSNDPCDYDSARFKWTADTIWNNDMSYDLWAPDTNNIFTLSWAKNFILRKNNGLFTRYDFSSNENVFKMVGDNINNGYLFGVTENYPKYKPTVWKWTGNGFSIIPTNFVSEKSKVIQAALYVNPNEMWIASVSGAVLKYDGTDFTQYDFPDSLYFMNIFYDKQNKLKILAAHPGTLDTIYFYIYEFDNNTWKNIYYNFIPNNRICFDVFNNELIGRGKGFLYSFDGRYFSNLLNLCNNDYVIFKPAGQSINNMLGLFSRHYNSSIYYHWNGIKWSNEKIEPIEEAWNLQFIMINNDNFASVIYYYFSNKSVIYQCKRK
jgi:hypothetical protein